MYNEEPHNLTKRELEVMELITLGYTNMRIASKLCIEESTVCTHINNIYSKFNLNESVENSAKRINAVNIYREYKTEIKDD